MSSTTCRSRRIGKVPRLSTWRLGIAGSNPVCGSMKPRKYSEALFREAVETSTAWIEVVDKLHLSYSGSRYNQMRRYAKLINVDTKHLTQRQPQTNQPRPLEEILVEDSPWRGSPARLKRRLVRDGLLDDVCLGCGTGPIWNNKPLTLQLDHVNGVWRDNRLENLQVLCPNCHSQTPTWGSKNRKKIAANHKR